MAANAEFRTRHRYDGSEFDRGMAKARQDVEAFATGRLRQLGDIVAGAFTVGKLVEFGREALTTAKEVTQMAAAFNMSRESYQSLMDAAMRGNVGPDKMLGSLNKLQAALEEGRTVGASETLVNSLRTLGIAGMSTEGAIVQIAQKLRDSSGDANVTTAAMEVLGKRGFSQLANALKEVADGFEKINAAKTREGEIISNHDLDQLEQYNKKLEHFNHLRNAFVSRAMVGMYDRVTAGFQTAMEHPGRTAAALGLSVVTGGASLYLLRDQYRKALADQTSTSTSNAMTTPGEDANGAVVAYEFEKRRSAERAKLQAEKDDLIRQMDMVKSDWSDQERIRSLRQTQSSLDVKSYGQPNAPDSMAAMGLFAFGATGGAAGVIAEQMLDIQRRQLDTDIQALEIAKATRDHSARLDGMELKLDQINATLNGQ